LLLQFISILHFNAVGNFINFLCKNLSTSGGKCFTINIDIPNIKTIIQTFLFDILNKITNNIKRDNKNFIEFVVFIID
jgi:hypothetical protein